MAENKSISRESILFAVIGLLLGIVVATLFAANAVNNDMQGMMRMMGMKTGASINEQNHMMPEMMGEHGMSMEDMSGKLQGKSGDEFDKEFINLMIEHHQGAIDMANLAKTNAKHTEIKNLADDIISAQEKEIEMMGEWKKQWGY